MAWRDEIGHGMRDTATAIMALADAINRMVDVVEPVINEVMAEYRDEREREAESKSTALRAARGRRHGNA